MTRYAICGLSRRALGMYALPLLGSPLFPGYGDYSAHGELVGILDIDMERVRAFNTEQGSAIPSYEPKHFDRMVSETTPQVVIIASTDGTHAEYIIKSLENDLDVITEKPMVIDCAQAGAVIDAEKRSRGSVRVIHNARYAQPHMQIKRMIRQGLLGRVTNVEFTWNVDTYHGSSYFHRWNRDRSQSGGLTITKGCHHFDLINWWLDDRPEQVFAYGTLNYYGPDSPHNPSRQDDIGGSVAEQKRRCPYHRRWHVPGLEPPKDDHLRARERALDLPYTVQYPQDRPMYIYDEEIRIEDTYSVVVRYRGGASMAYSANFSAPWEGYVLGINGTHGRLETVHYTAPSRCPFPVREGQQIAYYPLFGERQVHETRQMSGGHGGADPLLRHELFVGPLPESEELDLPAGSLDGAYAVAVGEAAWRSVEENRPIDISDLLPIERKRSQSIEER
ncbi:MAG: Gfo/Idh/MocA family oxidoreductase [Chloroflexia bacterium]|nr:Gfo/Idh/MocA family oxidoreductase [Chloroflexia bacterium]